MNIRIVRLVNYLIYNDYLCQINEFQKIEFRICILLNFDVYLVNLYHTNNGIRFSIQTLNGILLTSSELFELRNQLKELRTKEARDLFCCLYRSWCHNPVATVAILLLSQVSAVAKLFCYHYYTAPVSG